MEIVLPSEEERQNATKIVEEFQYLLEKSQQLFAGLRDLPPTGRNWQPYFQRTFEVYTKLWKFQQVHRQLLENKDYYGLKRSEIGEAASKIELYYHYYLRTSETNYLFESYIFYDAIRERQYFKELGDVRNLALVVKKLRYYARFIVVCLLLNRNEMIRKLMDELKELVDDYTREFKPTDAAEWEVVISEISTFLEAEKKLTPIDLKGNLLPVSSRVQIERTAKFDKDGIPKLKLQEAILVGNFQNQIKFSELTLDMYRVLQALEREPSSQQVAEKKDDGTEAPAIADEGGASIEKNVSTRRNNPHKYLLYRPSFSQLMLYIATAFKDVSDGSALLVYLSADGAKRIAKSDHPESGYQGGISTAVSIPRKPTEQIGGLSSSGTSTAESTSLIHCLHPYDLVPFTRKPLFVIVDSTNSIAFKSLPKIFPAPLVVLMGPTEYPTTIKDTTQIGSLFTLFLHSPLKAFSFISDLNQIGADVWGELAKKCMEVEKVIVDVVEANINNLDKSYRRFLQDDFLRQFIVRFVFTHVLLSVHTSFKDPKHFPTSQPQISSQILTSPEILQLLNELATLAGVSSLYNFSSPTIFSQKDQPPPQSQPVAGSSGNILALSTTTEAVQTVVPGSAKEGGEALMEGVVEGAIVE